jgi:hypothetical protein
LISGVRVLEKGKRTFQPVRRRYLENGARSVLAGGDTNAPAKDQQHSERTTPGLWDDDEEAGKAQAQAKRAGKRTKATEKVAEEPRDRLSDEGAKDEQHEGRERQKRTKKYTPQLGTRKIPASFLSFGIQPSDAEDC